MMSLKFFCACVAAAVFTSGALADSEAQPLSKTLGTKSFHVRNKQHGDLLRPEEARGANGTPIVLYPAQPWKCLTWKFQPLGESQFQLQNHFTSKTFAASARAGQPDELVLQVPLEKSAEAAPVWQFTRLNGGGYKIADPKTGKVLTAVKEKTRSGIRIVVQTWHESEDQQWELIEVNPKDLSM
jgi:hypothetical protein